MELSEVNVFGLGSGNLWDLPERTMDLIRSCGAVMGDRRLLNLIPPLEWQVRIPLFYGDELIHAVEGAPKPLAVLVSGDTGFFSLAQRIYDSFPGRVRLFPGISSLQMMAARIGRSWANVPVISLHGRPFPETASLRRALWEREEAAFLMGPGEGVREVLQDLFAALGMPRPSPLGWIGWDLGTSKEQVFGGTMEDLLNSRYTGNLSVLWLVAPPGGFFGEVLHRRNSLPPLDQDLQRRQGVPMTKFPVRCAVSSLLEPLFGARVLEVGSGSGGITSHLGKMVGPGEITSIERDQDALNVAQINASRLCPRGAVTFVPGQAPLEDPRIRGPYHRVVVGGHGGQLREIIRWALPMLSPGGRILVPCLLLSSAQAALEEMSAAGLKAGFIRVFPGEGRPLGEDWMVQGGNPVDLVWGDLI